MNFFLLILAGALLGAFIGFLLAALRAEKKLTEKSREIARLEAEKEAQAARLADLSELEKKSALHFENLANRIFEEKSTTFKKQSQEGLGQMLAPLREQLQVLDKKIIESGKEQFSLKKEIESIVLQAEGLTKALKGDSKTQGNWGEVMLEKILEDSGLRKGEDYILQGTDMGLKHAESNRALKPDVIVRLPEDKHIIIDAKVSLTAYERFCTAETEEERTRFLKEHIASLRAHVAGLEKRGYQAAEKLGTPDFVLMFMPIEGAWALAVQNDPDLHGYAWNKKIVIVCPSTLFATLKTISSVWRIERQNSNARQIAERGGRLYDKVVLFVEDMEKLGSSIESAQKIWTGALNKLSTGRGNILTQIKQLENLGAKVSKKLPDELLEEEETETEEEETRKIAAP